MADGDPTIYVSFVHGFQEAAPVVNDRPLPALWQVDGAREQVHRYVFPLSARDLDDLPYTVKGELPRCAWPQEPRARFGFTGLATVGDRLYAGSWNGVYAIDRRTMEVDAFLTNRYTAYLHGIHADEDRIIVAMPYKDLVVIMDHEGNVLDRFMIDRGLDVVRDFETNGHDTIDWRFVHKPWSGTTGFYHFNYVQRIDDEIVLTSRNLGALVVVDPTRTRATLRTLNYRTTTCIHDGLYADGRYHFTSIDGKIIIATEPPAHDGSRYNYDLQATHHRLGELENNWCRGIAVTNGRMYVTLDGRYGTDLGFRLVELDRASIAPSRQWRLSWKAVAEESKLRFVTGFDIRVGAR